MGKLQSVSRIPTIIGASHVAADLWAARFASEAATTTVCCHVLQSRSSQFFEQLLFQMPTGCLFNRAPLSSHRVLFRLAFFPCPALC